MYIFKWGNSSMINFTNEITFISSLRSNRCLRRDMRLVMQVCERDLSLILDVVHHTIQEERSRGDYYPLPGSDCPDWCVCGRCREMSSEEKGECCRQTPVNCICSQPVIFFSDYHVHKNMIEYVLSCSLNLPNMLSFQDFDYIVLDPLVLLLARRHRQVLIRCYTAWA